MEKRKLVFIHGMCWNGANWRKTDIWHYFNDRGYECITLTLPRHNLSPHDQPHPYLAGTGMKDYIDYVEKFLRNQTKNGEKVDIIAHSMGALITQIVLSRGFTDIGKAVLLNSAWPRGIFPFSYSAFKSFFKAVWSSGFQNKVFRPNREAYDYALGHTLAEPAKTEMFDSLVYESGRAVFEILFWWLDNKKDTEVDYEKVSTPLLFVCGGQDRVTPASTVKKNANKYKRTELLELPDAGHMAMLEEEYWKTIAMYTENWLKEK